MFTKKQAIEKYIIAQSKKFGIRNRPVILLPEFAGDDATGWVPVEGNGVRASDKMKEGQGYIRLGMCFPKEGEIGFYYTNSFKASEKLENYLDAYDVKVGDQVEGTLIAHERMTPFRKTNSSEDIKWVDKAAGVMCTFTGTIGTGDEAITYDTPAPIYRRIEWSVKADATDILIKHTNFNEISAHGAAKWAKENGNAKSTALTSAGAKAARIAELKAIAKSKRTPEQVAELADLMED